MLAEGTVIAEKYRVERVLGQGGMGFVVAARHLELDDRVAIKLLLPQMLDNAHVVSRFITEARAARRIRSEHVAKVLDVGTLPTNGAPFMVMEYLEGEDLGSMLERQGPLRVDLAVEYVLQACEALAEAHMRGIVHRDLKPTNLFLTRAPGGAACVKVLDFGIAKLGDNAGRPTDAMTRTSGMIGTALYASPEQLQSAKTVDARTDVWSIGVTLFELISGRFPFACDEMPSLIAHILTVPALPISNFVPDIDPRFVAVIHRCLEKDREQRYSSIAELALALGPFGAGDSARHVQNVLRIAAETSTGQTTSTSLAAVSGLMISANTSAQPLVGTSPSSPSAPPWSASSPRTPNATPQTLASANSSHSSSAPAPPKRSRAGLVVLGACLMVGALGAAAYEVWRRSPAPASRATDAVLSISPRSSSSPALVDSLPVVPPAASSSAPTSATSLGVGGADPSTGAASAKPVSSAAGGVVSSAPVRGTYPPKGPTVVRPKTPPHPSVAATATPPTGAPPAEPADDPFRRRGGLGGS